MQTQETTAKDSHPEEPKVKEVKLTSSWDEKANKPSEQACKEKKRKKYPKKRDKKEQPLASTTNTTEIDQKKKKKNQDRDISKIMYYNSNKKGHYANIYTKPKN